MSAPRHSVSVAGIVVAGDGRVLLIQRRDNQHWEPPGGVLELGESIRGGVRREVLEETGVSVDVGPLTGVYKNMPHGIVALVFRCTARGGVPRSTAEANESRWMTLEEAKDVMTPAYFTRVVDAFDQGVAVRSHDGVDLLET